MNKGNELSPEKTISQNPGKSLPSLGFENSTKEFANKNSPERNKFV
jgi:hypothetical protein